MGPSSCFLPSELRCNFPTVSLGALCASQVWKMWFSANILAYLWNSM